MRTIVRGLHKKKWKETQNTKKIKKKQSQSIKIFLFTQKRNIELTSWIISRKMILKNFLKMSKNSSREKLIETILLLLRWSTSLLMDKCSFCGNCQIKYLIKLLRISHHVQKFLNIYIMEFPQDMISNLIGMLLIVLKELQAFVDFSIILIEDFQMVITFNLSENFIKTRFICFKS